MMKKFLCVAAALVLRLFSFAQVDSLQLVKQDSLPITDTLAIDSSVKDINIKRPIYKLKPAVDIPLFAINAGWSGYAFTKIYSKEHSSEEKILSLDKEDINGFDRWAVRPYNKSIDKSSYYPFYGSTLLPFLFLIDKQTSKDFFKLGFLYLEAMSITGLLYTGSVYVTNRYRPYTYSSETTMPQRTRGGAKNSFYAGHVALVATSTFFMAKVYGDYHPDSKIKWVFYSIASATTAYMAYQRHRAGQHFPTDLLLGIAQGTLTGILVPHFHKHRIIKDPNLGLVPYSNRESNGLALVYEF